MPETAWTIRKSNYIMKDRWLGLRADDCVTPSGHVLDPYYVLETADIALVLGIDAADHVILVRQYRHAYGSPSLELPGGAIDPGDTDILAAAEREIHEETGYTFADAERVVTLNADPARYANRMHLVRARDRGRAGASGSRRRHRGDARAAGRGSPARPVGLHRRSRARRHDPDRSVRPRMRAVTGLWIERSNR
ncbi:NUDIX hydrolase [Methylobacterium fujisawaense]|uniref:NUDIX hydrolase n=1 Tax=Methylobacterium fujisawaense TaxID=107400 RepID=UPI00313C1E81